jgi:hypothetical protein
MNPSSYHLVSATAALQTCAKKEIQSASPYNLYPFIHKFIHDHYKPGTLILRDSSWMVLGGLLKSLTQGTQAYKTNRMNKIHDWLPTRKIICVGDSTQSDPEAYAEMFNKFPSWIVSCSMSSGTISLLPRIYLSLDHHSLLVRRRPGEMPVNKGTC